jgi:hypothetical protein
MQWKFWRRKKKRGGEKADGLLTTTSQNDIRGIPVPPLAISVKDVLGLQRLVGNQAVLRILAPEILVRAPDAKKVARLVEEQGRLPKVTG